MCAKSFEGWFTYGTSEWIRRMRRTDELDENYTKASFQSYQIKYFVFYLEKKNILIDTIKRQL